MKTKKKLVNRIIDVDKYPKPDWAVQQIIRSNGLVENVCEHGVGHPSKEFVLEHDHDGLMCLSIHCCDGCCSKSIRDIREGKI